MPDCTPLTHEPPAVAEFHHEIDARRHALHNLLLMGIGLTIGAVVGLVMFRYVGRFGEGPEWLMTIAYIILMGFNFALFAFVFLPLAITGGTYRVTIAAGHLRVESPHWLFGKSFNTPLSEIARLV